MLVRFISGTILLILMACLFELNGQEQPQGKGKGQGKGPDAKLKADQDVFHFLLENHKDIKRTVKLLDNGVETLTESDKPEIATKIQEHVEAMHQRVKDGRGLRYWDELFAEIFKHYDKIKMTVEKTKKGVLVKETSEDKYVVKLIQAHAEVVSQFVASGFNEARKNHEVPKDAPKVELIYPIIPKFGGVVPLPKAVEQPRKGSKIVFDVTADSKEVNKGLERAARLLNLYGSAGLKATDVKITIILHGEATKVALSDEAYKAKFSTEANPNLPLIRELQKAGVEVLVCGQAVAYKGFQTTDIAKEVPIALAALTVIINRQTDGYVCVPIP